MKGTITWQSETDTPSDVIWVWFDRARCRRKIRHNNKHSYANGVQRTWTPIKSITAQSAAGTAQVVIKQFPLRSEATKHHTQIPR